MGRRKQQVEPEAQPPQPAAVVENDDDDDDSMDVDELYVRLKTSDGKYFSFSETEASCSNALKRMLESSSRNHLTNNQGRAGDHIALQSVDSKVLASIHQWCKLHSYNRSSVSNGYQCDMGNSLSGANDSVEGIETDAVARDGDNEQDVGQRQPASGSWDMIFLASFSELDLLRITSAANFLDIKQLYDSCCKFIAKKWEGMKVDEIRQAYNIHDDFAADEEIQIIQENKRIGLSE